MKKIILYYGPRFEFDKLIPESFFTLDQVVRWIDIQNRFGSSVNLDNNSSLVGYSMSYSGITEGAEQNFVSILDVFNDAIDEVYLQNPTEGIRKEIERFFSKEIIEIRHHNYAPVSKDALLEVNSNFDNRIIGQNHVKEQLLPILYNIYKGKNEGKPSIIMFYGNSGIGKTETAKFISDSLGGNLFRKQLSMFQNNELLDYLFGTKHSASSFTKDLLERESNVILLDEFDKAYFSSYNAFYQVFDEGIFEDKNYKVNLKNTIIICTSNYKTPEEIRRALGDPIFFRFDRMIKFEDLTLESKIEIINQVISEEYKKLNPDERQVVHYEELKSKYIEQAKRFVNYRHIKFLIQNDINGILVRYFLENH
ncbi:AAA family ATPase [Bacillus wiedmannii]|uniref:AAA family ATPase n=2 Tax=Bacillus wiedmannii TaxID=1890302 RepID=UPI002112A378|nr:AAA family ATPase [Bacillus wiedmannii]MCQ6574293.1 AAA family ATPase [Bacillus wiedmannii]